MNDGNAPTKTITLFGLIMMIFTAIFGFANTTVAYEQMGLASILWYVFVCFFFFLPVGFMVAEYGSAFNEARVEFTLGLMGPLVLNGPLLVPLCG